MTAAAPRLVVVAGTTGSGKSELALQLAERLGGEIVNADAMQLYRGLDIGTAKVSPERRRGIPHHQLDVLDLQDIASVAAYQRHSRVDVEGILERGRPAILVGGSGLYLRAVIDEINFPPTDPAVRSRLAAQWAADGGDALRQRLLIADPSAAAGIEAGNGRRIVRALEVIELTGRPFSATMPTPDRPRYDAALLCLDRPTDELDRRLAERVEAMMAAGFLAEVQGLASRGLRSAVTASRALGYPQLLRVLDGELTLPEASAQILTATRRFVRRQRSWFRRDQRLTWLDGGMPGLTDAVEALVAR